MILSIYCYRDKKLGRFTNPVINNIERDTVIVTLQRSLVGLDKAKLANLRDLELYYLGTFDDKSGSISLADKEFIVSLDSMIAESEVSSNERGSEEEDN